MGIDISLRAGLVVTVLVAVGSTAGHALAPTSQAEPDEPAASVASVAGAAAAADVAGVAGAAPAPQRRPNVILVTTDDQRADDLLPMRHTRRLLGQLRLTDFVSNHPLCCPARAELLTGQLGQRNGVHANAGRWGGYDAMVGKDNTLGAWFRRGGYSTALVGKFTNGWCPSTNRPPAGWTDFTPLVRNAYSPYHYFYVEGPRVLAAPRGVHTNDFVTRRTLDRIREYAAEPRPFLIWSSYVAPHDMEVAGRFGPPVPAARHVGDLEDARMAARSSPSYQQPTAAELARASVADVDTCGGEARASARRIGVGDRNQRRLESLLSVDEGVRRMVRTLQEVGELRRTVIVFTSDNGYLLGEHGKVGKNSFYEESLRVPFFARGPGVASGAIDKGAMITDIAPSLARLASVGPGRPTDGRRDLFAAEGGWRRLLIQAGDERAPWLWRGVRTPRWSYVERTGRRPLLFDRWNDPDQVHNVAADQQPVVELLRSSLRAMTR